MLLTIETKKPVARVRADLEKACAAHQFGVLGVIDLREKMREKGVPYANECLVFEVCNPKQAKRALEGNPAVSTMLPCRISVYGTSDGRTHLSTMRPTKLLGMFGASGDLACVAGEVEQTLDAILHDAAR